MYIEDEELRSLYRDASSDHLNTLEAGLLHLEKHPQDADRIKELLRATHSIKGDSRMLGVKDAETLTHQMEDLLSTVSQGERTFTPELCESLYQGLDAVRQVVNEAITGEPSEVSVFHVLAQLMNTEEDDGEYPQPVQDAVSSSEPSLTPAIPSALKEPSASNVPVSESLIHELMANQAMESSSVFESKSIPDSASSQEWLAQSFDEASLFSMPDTEFPLYPGAEESGLEAKTADQKALAESLVESLVDLLGDDTDEDENSYDQPDELKVDEGNAELELQNAPSMPFDDAVFDDLGSAPSLLFDDTGFADLGNVPSVPVDDADVAPLHPSKGYVDLNTEMETAPPNPPNQENGTPPLIPDTPSLIPDTSPLFPDPLPRAETTQDPLQEVEEKSDGFKTIRQNFEQYISPTEKSQAEAIETVRVKASKLDSLMTQSGELAVTQRRISRRMGEIEGMLLLWEKWTQDTLAHKGQIDRLKVKMGEEAFATVQKGRQIDDDYLSQFGTLLKRLYSSANEDAAQLNSISNEMESGILQLRQLPLNSLFSVFPRMVRDIAKQQGKTINFVVEGGETQADKRIVEEMKAPLTHLIRNAIDHGIETPEERAVLGKSPTATLTLKAYQQGNQIILEVIDDGRGLNLESVKRTALRRGLYSEAELDTMSPERIQSLIFAPGFSTRSTVTEISGRGVGLDVVRVNVERLKGTIQVQSIPAQGCTFRFTLKTTVGTTSALILEVDQTPYALPLESIDRMMRVEPQEIFSLEGRPTITVEDRPISVVWLRDLLNLPLSVATPSQNNASSLAMTCVVLQVGSERLGVFVDQLIDQQDIVLKTHSKLLKRVRNIAGATILGTGQVCMVLSPTDLIRSAQGTTGGMEGIEWAIAPSTEHRVLLVEDSLPIRTQVRRILEGAGYQVTTAVDGSDGLEKLEEENFDAVVSDVEMPNLDGLGLTAQIRQQPKYGKLPIILVTTLAKDEDKRRGALAGASAYITKGNFDQSLLIQTLRRLI